jgi:hypothetical protein
MDHTIFIGLTAGQRKAIETIIEAESNGVPLTRVLKTTYSCRWCGRVIGRPGDSRDRRKLLLLAHEQNCEFDTEWTFATSVSTFYSKWMKLDHFADALDAARSMATTNIMRAAAVRLQAATLGAANELARQVTEADGDGNRRLAAVAILDRADVSTASKQTLTEIRIVYDDLDSDPTETTPRPD